MIPSGCASKTTKTPANKNIRKRDCVNMVILIHRQFTLKRESKMLVFPSSSFLFWIDFLPVFPRVRLDIPSIILLYSNY